MALAISKKRKVINENQCFFKVKMDDAIASLIKNNGVHRINCVFPWKIVLAKKK